MLRGFYGDGCDRITVYWVKGLMLRDMYYHFGLAAEEIDNFSL